METVDVTVNILTISVHNYTAVFRMTGYQVFCAAILQAFQQ